MIGPFADIWELFFPKTCAACGCRIGDGADFLCNYCRWAIPLTDFWHKPDNPICAKFDGHVPIENASAFYYFVHGSGFRDLIHRFKYHGGWRIAEKMGEWYGSELASSKLYADIDLIIPVPLHIRKRIIRGYNQSEYIACGMSRAMGVPIDCQSIKRSVHNRSQTRHRRKERWNNVEGIFSVRRPSQLEGRHILIVDDVMTTGATLISLCNSILQAAPDCRISIATLAVSKSELDAHHKTY